jgi:hypothetical protein
MECVETSWLVIFLIAILVRIGDKMRRIIATTLLFACGIFIFSNADVMTDTVDALATHYSETGITSDQLNEVKIWCFD